MAAFRFFHSVVWWSLVLSVSVSATQITTPVDDNDSAPMEPHSVKDMLHFLGKLQQDTNLKEKFVNELEKVVKEYLDTTQVEKKGYTANFDSLLEHVNKLRHELLNDTGDYGKFKDLNEEGVTKAFEILVQWIPILHSEFSLLYFLSSTEGQGIGGNQWIEQYFGPEHTGTQAHKWLTDKLNEAKDPFTVKKGFEDGDLKRGGRITAAVTGNLGINYYSGGPLNYMQYGLFFLSGDTLLAANLASALLFLAEFCREVSENKFPEKTTLDKYKCLKDVCKDVKDKIDAFHKHILPLYNPLTVEDIEGDDDSKLGEVVRMAEGRCNEMYKGKLKKEKFDEYVTWMKRNLAKLMLLLREMHTDSARWTVEDLMYVQSHGPSKYGYTFVDKRWDTSIYFTFKQSIEDLALFESSNGLFSLLRCLDGQRALREREVFEKLEEEKKKKEEANKKVRRVAKPATEVGEGEGNSSGKQTPVPTPPTGKTQLKEQTLADGHSEDPKHKGATKQTSETVPPAHQTTAKGPPTENEAGHKASKPNETESNKAEGVPKKEEEVPQEGKGDEKGVHTSVKAKAEGTANEASFSAYSVRVATAFLALLSVM